MSAPAAFGPQPSRIIRWWGRDASPARIGLSAGALLFGAIALWELAFGRFGAALAEGPPHDIVAQIRVAITHATVVAYLIGATAYALRRMDTAVESLRPHLSDPDAGDAALLRSRRPGVMRAWALVGVVLAVLITAVSPGERHFEPLTWGPETVWHRGLALALGFWFSRLVGLASAQSLEISRLARSVCEVDLLTLEPMKAVSRFGLSNALIATGVAATYSLFLVDAEYLTVVPVPMVGAFFMASLGLIAPLLGARQRIKAAKDAELAVCRSEMHAARADLAGGEAAPQPDVSPLHASQLHDWVAWETRIVAVPEWPLDAGSLGRFALYLLIPLGSWSGGALVERGLDLLLR